MNAVRLWMGTVLFAVTLGATFANHGQAGEAAKSGEYEPKVWQAGKDVVWVPTPDELVERMLRMAETTANDYVMDLGSGDGRTVIAAVKKFGATATGIEYNPEMVTLSQRSAQREGVSAKATFMKADLFETDLSKATVITMYLLPTINARLKPKILGLKPGTRVVSHAFDMEDWGPDEKTTVGGVHAFLWIVPARVAGQWRISLGLGGGGGNEAELSLTQRYQMLEGDIRFPRMTAGLREPRLSGERISFTFMDPAGKLHHATGRVNADRMQGTMRAASGGAEVKWAARR